ncbi:MAG TPA: hypothetical protein VHR66_07970 [Gemmataceae bacterium]|jgi:hypothetical protein|nr:hypothetical protein [Gemmataceae bacterium]
MSDSSAVTVKLRIPGQWKHPGELIENLPAKVRLTPETLTLADGTEFEFIPMQADDQFAKIFRSSLRNPAEPDELVIVDNYTVNVCLIGPGGSMDAAQKLMDAGTAIIRAGGAGVFIDNSAVGHGGQNWVAMAEDGSSDALSFAFVAMVGNRKEAYTMGMHVLGLRDIVMKTSDAEQDEFGLVDVIRYVARGDKPINDGHILMELDGPRFQAIAEPSKEFPAGSPMHNPFGRLRLVSMKDLAERN